ncbi:hypothetical protein [Brytella acorum]|uniref:Lipoprotein n=1 Tax=Brytella acorum TaxID=2959299 RepID=A0AA35UQY4_9PROT|nr:hypothetical protein [Brytella acorum]MDF3625165.1 hypothetical protein [Brytella acorum]CAI9122077.1 hypothetical protein LMG32879_002934 [Brytella acorum]
MMIARRTLFPVLATVIALTGCETPSDRIIHKEDHLQAAGFAFRPADTPTLQNMLNTLPDHRFLRRVKDGKTFYVYSDPTICGCLYVGDGAAYDRYQAYVQQQAQADERRATAFDYQNTAWDWGPWMPGFNGWNSAWGNWDPGFSGPFGW